MRFWMAILLTVAMLQGCGRSGKKSENIKSFSDTSRKTSASGKIKLEAYSEQPNAVTTIRGDGIDVVAPGKANAEIIFNTDENIREQVDSDTHTEFFKEVAWWIYGIAALIFVGGAYVAYQFEKPIIGALIASVGPVMILFMFFPWVGFILFGLILVGVIYYIYEKHATDAKKTEAEDTIAKLKDTANAMIKAIEEKAGEVKGEITAAVKANAKDKDAVKDTITEFKREKA